MLTLLIIQCIACCFAQAITTVSGKSSPKLVLQEPLGLKGQALAEYVNKQQSLFEAAYTPNVDLYRASSMKMEFWTRAKELRKKATLQQNAINVADIPVRFDAREAWPQCKESIGYIRDQSACGSCWAVSAAEVMSDRICIQSNGTQKTLASDTDIVSCCGQFCGDGCNGGYPIQAWNYIELHGVCSGGRYGTQGNCKPYAFRPCGKHQGQPYYGECPGFGFDTPPCKKFCQLGYWTPYELDKVYAKSAYAVPDTEQAIQTEIMMHGPVQAGFDVYEDFHLYIKGIYKHVTGMQVGGHAVKIIGWGVENGTKYWTIANSWGTDWGEDGGYFRMIRGEDNCGIESEIVAGIMDV